MSGSTIRLLLVMAVAAATVMASACGGGAPTAAATPSAATTTTPSAAPSATPAANPVATTSVNIANFAFSPPAITVRAGATVTWTNQDEDAHTVAIAGTPTSQPLQNGDTFTHTFTQAGTYSYLCTIHPFMRGMVVVTAG